MNLQEIRYFLILSQELHFRRASERLNITQPTLSQAIKNLEKSLGVYLFERTPRKVSLTADGQKFLPYALSILDEIEKGKEALRSNDDTLTDTIRIGVIPTICPYLLPGLILNLRKEAPGISLSVQELTTSVLLDYLKEGRVDLGILSLPINTKGLSTLAISKEPFLLAVPKKHPLASKKSVSPKDIALEKILVLQEGHCFGEQALEFCKLNRKNPKIIFEGDSLTSVLGLVQAGEGVTLIPRMAIGSYPSGNLKFLPFTPPSPSRELGIVWRVTQPLRKSQKFLMEKIQETLKAAG